jgi:hypothetical protein
MHKNAPRIVSPSREIGRQEGYWFPKDEPKFWRKPGNRAIAICASCTVPAVWFLGQYTQLRGYVNLIASRIDLGFTVFFAVLAALGVAKNMPRYRKTTALIFVIGIVAISVWVDRVTLPSTTPKAESHPPSVSPSVPSKLYSLSLRQLFDQTPEGEIRVAPAHPLKYTNNRSHKSTAVIGVVLIDNKMQVYTLSFFVPLSDSTYDICKDLSDKVPYPYKSLNDLLKQWDQGDLFQDDPTPETFMTIKHPTFTGKVFIYHESNLTLAQKAAIDESFRRNKMVVEFRGQDYAVMQLYSQAVKAETGK